MIALLIAYLLVGATFFAGIAAEHRHWDLRDAMQFLPSLLLVMALWPLGVICREVKLRGRRACRG